MNYHIYKLKIHHHVINRKINLGKFSTNQITSQVWESRLLRGLIEKSPRAKLHVLQRYIVLSKLSRLCVYVVDDANHKHIIYYCMKWMLAKSSFILRSFLYRCHHTKMENCEYKREVECMMYSPWREKNFSIKFSVKRRLPCLAHPQKTKSHRNIDRVFASSFAHKTVFISYSSPQRI